MESNDAKYTATTVQKTISILNLLGKHEMSATAIATALGINKTTVHRLLYTLEGASYIERNPRTKMYRIGIKLVELCSLRLNDIEIKTEAKPFLMRLVSRINQPVHLGIYSDGAAVFIDKIDVMAHLRMYSAIGRTIPVHCSAIGKSLILNWSDGQVRARLEEFGMESFTPHTITSPDVLLEELRASRVSGYTTDNGEHEEDVCCLAAPVYDYTNKIVAAISTASHPDQACNQQEIIHLLKETSALLSERLGYIPSTDDG